MGKAPQTITFPAIPAQKVGTPPFTLGATSDSGLPVTYRLSDPAALSGNSVTGAGTVTVAAYCAGNSLYTTATEVKQSFVVAR